jgi:hypothetical protein
MCRAPVAGSVYVRQELPTMTALERRACLIGDSGAVVAHDGPLLRPLPLTERQIRIGRCRHDEFFRSRGSTERDRLRGVSRVWGLVAAPTAVCGVRPHWMLRQLSQPARDRACELFRSPSNPQLRARRGLVLELPNKRIHGRASPRTPAASSGRPTCAWTNRTSPRQLARPFGGVVTTTDWADALAGRDPQIQQISRNVLTGLG